MKGGKMEKIILLVVISLHYASTDRTYEDECPDIIPMPDFDIEKFFGIWYQVQPNFDSEDQTEPDIPSCEFYNITHSKQPNSYVVSTIFELYTPFDGNTPLKYSTISKSYLTSLDETLPAKMRVTPTSGAHIVESNLTIFITDYESYAVISNCNKEISKGDIQFTQYATLWSRTRDLSDNFVDKLYESIGSFEFDPYVLDSISTTGCIEGVRKIITVNLDNDEVIPN